MDADSRQIFIVSDTPPDFSEPRDTDSPPPRKLFIGGGGQARGGRQREGFVIEFRRNADRIRGAGFQGCEDSNKSKTARN